MSFFRMELESFPRCPSIYSPSSHNFLSWLHFFLIYSELCKKTFKIIMRTMNVMGSVDVYSIHFNDWFLIFQDILCVC